jgi:hypothetical protein
MQVISQRWLAKELGISPATLAHHLKKDDAPPLDDIEAWRTYLAEIKRERGTRSDIGQRIARKRLAVLEEQRKKLRRENNVKEGLMFEADAVTHFIQTITTIYFGELERLEQEAPGQLKGMNEVEIHKWMKEQTSIIKQKFRAKAAEGVK